jgi:serine/threonine-protein kinase HipA
MTTPTEPPESGSAKPRRRPIRAATGVIARARVHLWDTLIGGITEFENGRIGFSYEADYVEAGVSISPRFLPLKPPRTFEFAELRGMDAFLGLPGVLADSLPDTFGNLIIRSYFEARGEPDKAMSPVQRLLYVGNRAMGALEYAPHLQRKTPEDERALEVKALVESARKLIEGDTGDAVHEIMRVGGSAGGARAKALILWDRDKKRVRSGFARPKAGESAWMIKFDGVGSANALDYKAKPFNRIEYTYALLAKQLDIDMQEVDFIEGENGLFHFITRRFDRTGGHKHHMHSLGGITHVDFNRPQAYSYEAWFRLILDMQLGYPALEQAYRRMIFNIVGRNQDDHVKNISFLMKDKSSGWALAPAYDLTFAAGAGYTRIHQMTVTGRSDGFGRAELVELGKKFDIRHPDRILDRTIDTFAGWPALARTWKVPESGIAAVSEKLRLTLKG